MCEYKYTRGEKKGTKCIRAKNKEYCCMHRPEYMSGMRDHNRVNCKERSKSYYNKNKEAIKEKNRIRAQKNRDLLKEFLNKN